MNNTPKRRLALFFDGTWNTPGSDTNVFRLYTLTASTRSFQAKFLRSTFRETLRPQSAHTAEMDADQLTYYHRGVGTKRYQHLLGGMFGYGLSKNIRDGLYWLSSHYTPGDEIFIFGFSRGAYTARSLVGLIRKCGIPRQPLIGLTDTAYKFYRERLWDVDGLEAKAFRETYSWPDTKIKFIGVWDTVGALGIPIHQVWFGKDWYRFHDTQLSGIVENAYHAVALDEHRPDFQATLWTPKKSIGAAGGDIEQRWFPGSHADVGGGYPDGKLHELSLRWIQEKALASGLRFTGMVPVDPDAYLSAIHDSFRDFALGLYAKLPWIYEHYRPRKMGIHETTDDSVTQRRLSPDGRDEHGGKYDPPALNDDSLKKL